MLSSLMMTFISVSLAALNTSTPRGERIVKIPVAKSGSAEICVIPKKYPNALYTKKDIQTEQELCGLVSVEPVAICPKLVSTNPAVEFFSIPDGASAQQVEARLCDYPGAKKLAKYKNSTSCSYTPSLLSYYHVSRILGLGVQIPPAVLRTMNLQNHKAIASKGIANVPARSELLRQTWKGLAKHLKEGFESSKKDALFTSDFSQSYGALQINPRDEEKYSEMFFSAKGSETRAEAFRKRSPFYALLKDSKDVRSLVGNQWTPANMQKLVQMQNVADMIVLDHLLSQQDRFGNIHYTNNFFYRDSSKGESRIVHKKNMNAEEARATGAVMVKHMMLKDNECGIVKENMAQKAGLLRGLAHMNPTTYGRLLKLRSDVRQETTRYFFKYETLMTDSDYISFQRNLNEVVGILQDACWSGRLKLDLDLDGHFLNKPIQQNCG